jgi:hypothetical protein
MVVQVTVPFAAMSLPLRSQKASCSGCTLLQVPYRTTAMVPLAAAPELHGSSLSLLDATILLNRYAKRQWSYLPDSLTTSRATGVGV